MFFAPLDEICEALDNGEGVNGLSSKELKQLVDINKELKELVNLYQQNALQWID